MKSSVKNKSVKVIGKNCKYNLIILKGIKNKRCGLNHTCDCFDDNGGLCFDRINFRNISYFHHDVSG